MGIVTDIMGVIDNSVKSAGEEFFNLTAGAMLPIMTVSCSILLVLVGLNMAMGVYRMSSRDSVQLMMRILLIYLFAFSWSNFGTVYEAFSEVGGNLAVGFFDLAASSAKGDVYGAIDGMAVDMSDTADGVAKAQGSIMRGVLGAVLYIFLAVLMAIYVLIVAFAKIMIAFLLGLAPLAITATIFERSKHLFEAWISSFVGYLMYPIAASAIMATIIKVAEKQFVEQENAENVSQLLGFLVVVFVAMFALRHIPTAATNLTGQVHLANIAPEALRLGQVAATRMPGAGAMGNTREMAGGFVRGSGDSPQDLKKSRDRDLRERGARFRQRAADVARLRGK